MPLIAIFYIITGFVLGIASIKLLRVYTREEKKEYLYYFGCMAIISGTTFCAGLARTLFQNPMLINAGYIFAAALGLVAAGCAAQISFVVLHKPNMGTAIFWIVVGLAVATFISSASIYIESTKYESVIESIPHLIYWKPNYTAFSVTFMVITSMIGIMSFPFLFIVLMTGLHGDRFARMRTLFMTSGLMIMGLATVSLFLFHMIHNVYFVEITAVNAFCLLVGSMLLTISFFIKPSKEEDPSDYDFNGNKDFTYR